MLAGKGSDCLFIKQARWDCQIPGVQSLIGFVNPNRAFIMLQTGNIMENQKKAYIYGFATVFLWSTVASAFKISLRHLDPLQLLLCADMVSVMILFVILAVRKELGILRTYSKKDLLFCAGLGILNPFLYYMVLFKAYDLLPAQEAQPLNYTWAITLTLLSIPLLRQKVSFSDLCAILVSYFGVVIISTRGNPFSLHFSNVSGVFLALGSTVIWALYWIYNTKDTKNPVASLFFNFLFAFPFILLTTLVFSELPPASMPGLLGAAYVGIFEMGITFVLWLNALRLSSSAAKMGTLIFFSPFLSLIFIHFLVGEEILPSTVTGLMFIIAGNVLQKFFGKKAA